MRALIAAIAAAALLCFATAAAEDSHSNPWLLSWIPAYCCVTNDCCWEIGSDELESLPDDKWRVKTTGQVRERTNWSPDGKWYRCACDYDSEKGVWIRHLGANTRCLFVPMQAVQQRAPGKWAAR
jgi:hypothetical protein